MDSSVMMDESVLESIVYKQDTNGGHSEEDVNWADSCLVKVSENEWDSLKNSLLDILDSIEPSTDKTDHLSAEISFPDPDHEHESPKLDDVEETIHYSHFTSSDEEDDDDDDEITTQFGVSHKKKNRFRSRSNVGNSSVSVIHEFLQDNTYDFGLDFSFTESIHEPTSDEIFKVWDLDIPHEEDELSTDLKNALVDSTKEDDLNSKGFSNSGSPSLDELIMGMTDLSLDSNHEAY